MEFLAGVVFASIIWIIFKTSPPVLILMENSYITKGYALDAPTGQTMIYSRNVCKNRETKGSL